MERKIYLSEDEYGCKSAVTIREDKTIIVISQIETGFCAWMLPENENFDIFISRKNLIAFLLENDDKGFSAGMYDSYKELCNDLNIPFDCVDDKYFSERLD